MVELAQNDDKFFAKFEALLMDGAADVQATHGIPSALSHQLRRSFVERFGKESIPVCYNNQITEAGHYGKRGKVFGSPYVEVLRRFEELDLEIIRESFGTKVEHIFDTLELSNKEGRNLLRAKQLLGLTVENMPRIEVAKFAKGSNVRGLYHTDDHVTLNREILKDYGRTLAVLIHEVAHRKGGDGTKEHQDEMTRLWIAVATGPRRIKQRKI